MPTTAEYPSLRRYVLALGLSGPFDANEPRALPLGSGLTLRNCRRAGPAGELAVAYIVRSIDVQVTLWQFFDWSARRHRKPHDQIAKPLCKLWGKAWSGVPSLLAPAFLL